MGQVPQPKYSINKSIATTVKEKPVKSGSKNASPDWAIYSDSEMNNVLGYTKVGDSVTVLGWSTWLYFIKGRNVSGYISSKALAVNAELDSLAKVLERQSPIDEAAELKRLEELEKNKHADMLSKKYGKEDAEKILKGLYWIGMTKQMAEYSRGRPDKINTTVTANTTREQWIYRKFNLYLYFEDGILTSYQLF